MKNKEYEINECIIVDYDLKVKKHKPRWPKILLFILISVGIMLLLAS